MNHSEETTLKPYEVGYLLRSEEGVGSLADHLSGIGATVLFQSDLRNIKLAYPIEHLSSAYFGYAHFEARPDQVANLNAALKLNNQIIRFLIITPPVMREKGRAEAEPRMERGMARPKAEPAGDASASNDLLEEKLEEILNK